MGFLFKATMDHDLDHNSKWLENLPGFLTSRAVPWFFTLGFWRSDSWGYSASFNEHLCHGFVVGWLVATSQKNNLLMLNILTWLCHQIPVIWMFSIVNSTVFFSCLGLIVDDIKGWGTGISVARLRMFVEDTVWTIEGKFPTCRDLCRRCPFQPPFHEKYNGRDKCKTWCGKNVGWSVYKLNNLTWKKSWAIH